MNTINFFLSSFIIIVLPGIGIIYTISTGISQGKKPSLFAALGCTFGTLPHLFISIMFSAFIQRWNNTIFLAIKWAGILYLLYLGLGMLLHNTSLNLSDSSKETAPLSIIQRGILINLLNPKLTIFFFAFLPQYVKGTGKSYIYQCWFLGLLFMFITWLVFTAYGIFASAIKAKFLQSTKRLLFIQKIFGVIFILFALQFAIS